MLIDGATLFLRRHAVPSGHCVRFDRDGTSICDADKVTIHAFQINVRFQGSDKRALGGGTKLRRIQTE